MRIIMERAKKSIAVSYSVPLIRKHTFYSRILLIILILSQLQVLVPKMYKNTIKIIMIQLIHSSTVITLEVNKLQ